MFLFIIMCYAGKCKGINWRDLREDADLTQTEMGKAINLPQRTYAYYESGERTVPPEVLIAIAKYHKTSVDYILELTDKR